MTEPIQNDGANGAPNGHMRKFGGGAIASVIGLVLLLVFVLQNSKHVSVDFLFWTFAWPLWFLIIIAALLGALIWFGAGVVRRHRRRAERRDDRHS